MRKRLESEVPEVFLHKMIFTWELPGNVRVENGKYFTSKYFQNVCRTFGIPNLTTTSDNQP